MKFCKNCGENIYAETSVCPSCGHKVELEMETPVQANPVTYNPEEVTLKDALKFYGLCLIPFYNLYLVIKTAIGGYNVKRSLTNIVRANIIINLIIFGFWLLLFALVGATL